MAAKCTSFTPSNIVSGFRNTGLIPVNRDIILSKILAPSTIPSSSSPSENLQRSHEIHSQSTPNPQSITTYTAQEIDKL
ncbi:hypothetical protein L873DRAFT_1920598 [Choiromyces venosus 120613-1]|uniref:Uncharacterized protein n=1 Tax=Choiromyces venosus 120613-1 TaxID=1336337 RepID=A0A3N4JFV9_9PEZI|nr:hypothetical protein L873DRAFT_1920598 [Choiromyces venosus 120613-1]